MMLSFLPAPVRGGICFGLIVCNTLVMCAPLFLITLFKVVLPWTPWQKLTARWLIVIAEAWVYVNNFAISLPGKIHWDVEGLDQVDYEGWYLVVCNHQSWVDILVLQKLLTGKAPFLKFFLKQELIWVPVLGVAWWALDFPFMKRYSKEYLAKHPEMKGKDIETTRKACEKFKHIPVSIMNFLEGTRFTPEKHERQQSPYHYLLKPKSGGIAFVLSAMSGQLSTMIDVTIVYDRDGPVGLWDLMSGRLSRIIVRIKKREIPEEYAQGDYEGDPEFRARFQSWVNSIWAEKDRLIGELKCQNQISKSS